MSLKRKAQRTPSSSPLPKNCAPKMPAPETAPKMARLKTKISWLTMETPVICSVPTRPTMMLSSRLTKFVMPFWIMMGTATARTIL